MDHNKPQMYGIGFNPADYTTTSHSGGRNTPNTQQNTASVQSILPGNQALAYQNMLPLLYQNQMLGLGMQPQLFYGGPFPSMPPAIYNQGHMPGTPSTIPGLQAAISGQNIGQPGMTPVMGQMIPGMLSAAHLQGLLPGMGSETNQHHAISGNGYRDSSKFHNDKKNNRAPDNNDRNRGPQKHGNYRDGPRNDHRDSRDGHRRHQQENSGKGSTNKDKFGRGNQDRNRQQDIDPNTGKFRDRDEPNKHGKVNLKHRRDSIEESNEQMAKPGLLKGKDGRQRDDRFDNEGRQGFDKDRRLNRDFDRNRQESNWNRRKDSFNTDNQRDFKRRDSREREKPKYRDRIDQRPSSRDRSEFKDNANRRDRGFGANRDNDRDYRDRGRNFDKFNRHNDEEFRDRRNRFEDNVDNRRQRDRYGDGPRDPLVGKFKIINKPMDNIEGNSIPQDRPVSYICFDSNMPRRAVVLDMVKHKIGKYFLPEQPEEEVKGKPLEKEQEEAGLSDDEDLYHLTFKNRYFNDFVICQNCFKEGKHCLFRS